MGQERLELASRDPSETGVVVPLGSSCVKWDQEPCTIAPAPCTAGLPMSSRCSPSWHETHSNPPASDSLVLELQACSTVLDLDW